MMLETSHKDKPESKEQTQKKAPTNSRKRASSETEIYDSTKRARLSDNFMKDYPVKETKPNIRKDLKRHRKRKGNKKKPIA